MLIAYPQNKYPWLQFGLIIIFVLAVGVLSSGFVYFNVKKSLLTSLESRVLTLTAALPGKSIITLDADDRDLNKQEYINIKNILTEAAGVNDDVRFVYILGQSQDKTVFFYVDSEDPSSEDYSPPGQIYDEASPILKAVFTNGLPAIEGPVRDRWGNWISAMAPLKEESTGSVLGVVGMDISADHYWETLIVYSAVPMAVAFIVATLIFAMYRSKKKDLELIVLKSRFISVASHELRAPLSGVRWAIESLMSDGHAFSSANRDTLADMYERSSRMMTTLNNLSDIMAIESGVADRLNMVQFDLREALDEAVARTRTESGNRGVTVNLDQSDNVALILGDKDHLVRAFVELIRNALYYSSGKDLVNISMNSVGQYYEVSILDKGNPESRGNIDAIFRDFHKSMANNQSSDYGIGIGLYLARSVMQLHNGRLWFTRASDNGSISGTIVHCKFPKIRNKFYK